MESWNVINLKEGKKVEKKKWRERTKWIIFNLNKHIDDNKYKLTNA